MSQAPVLGGINRIEDIDAADDFQKKHTPYVTAERAGDKTEVRVKVGHWVAHPNMPDHFIQWIQVYVDDAPVAFFDLSAVAVDPDVACVIDAEPSARIWALANCNLHGLWAGAVRD